MINIMIVEDNKIVREGLVRFLNKQADLNIAAEAMDALSALQKLEDATEIDIVLADWNMPDMDGLELTNHITARFASIKVIILTMHGKQEYKEMAEIAGVKGFLLKHLDLDQLVDSIRRVANGEKVFM